MSDLPLIKVSSGHLPIVIGHGIDAMFQCGVSDITIQTDDYIWGYHNRQHKCFSDRRLDEGEVNSIVRELYKSDGCFGILGSGKPLDFEVDLRPKMFDNPPQPDYSVRCRANVTRSRVGANSNGASITLRTIPGLPPRLETLNLPEEIVETIFPAQGLVLVVGITGSGKSTLLASCNRHRLEQVGNPVKILTVEDPIEFVYSRLPVTTLNPGAPHVPGPVLPRMPEVSQVQIGPHLRDFADAAPNILRRKADVIVMGEMRDRMSVETGLLFAQTGHATYGTLHCETPAQAVARIVSEFEVEAQSSVANKLLDSLRLIVAQKIVRDTNGKGRAFRSWIVFDQALKERLCELAFPKWSQFLTTHMQECGTTFAQQALGPYRAGEISEAAFRDVAGFNPMEARRYLDALA